MVNQQLLDYVRQQLAVGVSTEQVKKVASGAGWLEPDIDQAFLALQPKIITSATSTTTTTLPNGFALLYEAWDFYKKRWFVFLRIQFLSFVFAIVPFLLLAILSVVALLVRGTSLLLLLLPIVILVCLITIPVVVSLGSLAFIYAIKDTNENIGAKEAFKRAWKKILSFWWLSLLSIWIVLGGMLLFVVPGLIFGIWFSFSTWVLIADDTKGIDALLKSREYIRGRFWSVLWRFFFLFLVYLLVSLVINFAIPFIAPFGGPVLAALGEIASILLSFVLFIVWYPLNAIYVFLLYSKLKVLRGTIISTSTGWVKAAYGLLPILGIIIVVGIFVTVGIPLLSLFSPIGQISTPSSNVNNITPNFSTSTTSYDTSWETFTYASKNTDFPTFTLKYPTYLGAPSVDTSLMSEKPQGFGPNSLTLHFMPNATSTNNNGGELKIYISVWLNTSLYPTVKSYVERDNAYPNTFFFTVDNLQAEGARNVRGDSIYGINLSHGNVVDTTAILSDSIPQYASTPDKNGLTLVDKMIQSLHFSNY